MITNNIHMNSISWRRNSRSNGEVMLIGNINN